MTPPEWFNKKKNKSSKNKNKNSASVADLSAKQLYAIFKKAAADGGEKKRNEIFQMALLEPRLAILDETDSGLDIDALRIVSEGATRLQQELGMGILVITHYQRLLDYVEPDYVHVLSEGRIVRSGDKSLALELEDKGYDWVREAANG